MKNFGKQAKLILEFVVMIVIAIVVGILAKTGVSTIAEIIFNGGK